MLTRVLFHRASSIVATFWPVEKSTQVAPYNKHADADVSRMGAHSSGGTPGVLPSRNGTPTHASSAAQVAAANRRASLPRHHTSSGNGALVVGASAHASLHAFAPGGHTYGASIATLNGGMTSTTPMGTVNGANGGSGMRGRESISRPTGSPALAMSPPAGSRPYSTPLSPPFIAMASPNAQQAPLSPHDDDDIPLVGDNSGGIMAMGTLQQQQAGFSGITSGVTSGANTQPPTTRGHTGSSTPMTTVTNSSETGTTPSHGAGTHTSPANAARALSAEPPV